ncbi:MAG: outer membrane protein assembly factor BamE, partial [Hyphomicrobiaceae bacterium]
TTTATVNNAAAYYYISSTSTQTAFLKPKEIDRKVLAVYFNPLGSVDSVANYGMKDGKVFDYISRKTPAPGGRDEGILKQLFRNLGSRQIYGDG